MNCGWLYRYCGAFPYIQSHILLSLRHAKFFLRTLEVVSVQPKIIIVYKAQYIFKEFGFQPTVKSRYVSTQLIIVL